jgi:peptidoglycan/xylan/chitin deacetylase (PgdA/CDA1 family)
MIRELAKTTVCAALARVRLERWIERGQPVVLGYHRVVDDAALGGLMPGLAVGVRMLEQHLEWIGRRCRFVTLDELDAALAHGACDRPLAAVTFDDGYRDVAVHAWPLLRRKGIPAALFVVTQAAATGVPLAHDRLYRALMRSAALDGDPTRARLATRVLLHAAPPASLFELVEELEAEDGVLDADDRDDGAFPLDYAALARLHEQGMTIGSHTRTHALLVGRDDATLRDELEGARRDLEARLGAPVRHFAYPDGQFDARVVQAVAGAGYALGFTTCHHRDAAHPLLTVPRTMLWQRSSLDALGHFSGAVLSCQAHGALPFLDPCHRQHEGACAA